MTTSEKSTLDPQQQQIGAVYAKSLLAAARESGDVDDVVAQLEGFADEVLAKQPRLTELMTSTRVTLAEKLQLLDRTMGTKISSTLLKFLKVVTRKGRFDCLPAIAQQTRRLYNEEAGVLEAQVISAAELSDETRSQIVSRLEAVLSKKVNLSSRVDPSMLGGLKIRVGDTVFDGSLQTQLERVRKSAFEKSAEQIRAHFDRFASAQ